MGHAILLTVDEMHDILIWHNLLETGILRNKNMDFCVLILSVYFNDNFLKIDSYSDKISHHIFQQLKHK